MIAQYRSYSDLTFSTIALRLVSIVNTILFGFSLSTYRFASRALCYIAATEIVSTVVTGLLSTRTQTSDLNIAVSRNSSGLVIHLNNERKSDNWQEDLWALCTAETPTNLMHCTSPLNVRIEMRLDASLAILRGLTSVLDLINRYSKHQARAVHPLQLTINVTQDPTNPVPADVMRTSRMRLDTLIALRKLTWSGPASELFFFSKNVDADAAPRTFSALKELSLVNCALSVPDAVRLFMACPHLTRCEIDSITDAGPAASAAAAASNPPARVTYQDLSYLHITSSAGLQGFFQALDFTYLEELSMRLSHAATQEPHTIQRLKLPWKNLRDLKVSAPFTYADLVNLKRFIDMEPSACGRRHNITDWSSFHHSLRDFTPRRL